MNLRSLTLLAFSCSLAAQGVEIYSNGPIVTHPGGGVGGGDASALQNGLPHNMNVYGHNCLSTTFRVADDFTVNGVWFVDGIEFFCYQTGATAASITDIRIEIYNGDPTLGGVPIAGSPGIVNNLFTTAGYTVVNTLPMTPNIQRTLITGLAASTARLVQSVRVNLPANLVLDFSVTGTNTYWIAFATNGTIVSGPWCPPVTVLGSPNVGNAKQWTGAAWTNMVDTGNPLVPVPYTTAVPFKLYGIPTTLPGAITSLGGGCSLSGANFAVRGSPAVGGVVHSEIVGTLNPLTIPAIVLGFSDPAAPLFVCACTSHATLDQIIVGTSFNWQVPMVVAGVGFQFYLQGAQIDLIGGFGTACNLGLQFEFTDAFGVRFY